MIGSGYLKKPPAHIFIKERVIHTRGTIKMNEIKKSDYVFAVLPVVFALFIIVLIIVFVRPLLSGG